MKDYLQYYKNKPDDGTYETKCYNAFIDKVHELSNEIDIENKDGEFLGWEKEIFDQLFTNTEIFIGCAIWRGDIELISEEYGKDEHYWYRTSDIFTEEQRKIIDEAIDYVEEKIMELDRD